jgi:hypothetical protein
MGTSIQRLGTMVSIQELLSALAVKDEIIDAQRKTIEQLQNLLSTRQSTTQINLVPEVPSSHLSIEELQARLDRMTKSTRNNNTRTGPSRSVTHTDEVTHEYDEDALKDTLVALGWTD